jgi:thermitase
MTYVAALLGVLIAVLDTGVDITHPHFQNTYVTTYNIATDGTDASDTCHHGTGVAGLVVDAAPDADLLIVKVYADNRCTGSTDLWARGVVYATDQGADIIVLALGNYWYSQQGADAIEYAIAAGVLVIAAAGNDASASDFYPAAYQGVMVVADGDWQLSNYGERVSVSVPSYRLMPITINGQYEYGYSLGTSFSAPVVAGLAASLLHVDPTLSAIALRGIIERTARDTGALGWDEAYGHGVIDEVAAMREVLGVEGEGELFSVMMPMVVTP